ncbi:hypothetical protein [Paenibacillus sp. GP183]|nr:hypothetical protein [Paenibacillus sp. GP183]SEB99078.1 hypothetical protein SAMN05443246_2592 [Paenibacillus sp. GP183]
MFGTKSSKKVGAVQQKGQASQSKMNQRKSAASTIAVYGTSTIVGKVKAN